MSFVGFLSVTGLALAVAVLVTVISVVNGFDKELRERVLGVLPQGGLYAKSEDFDWQRLRKEVLLHPGVTGAAPSVEGTGLAMHAGRFKGIRFRGIDTELESSVSSLLDFVPEVGIRALPKQKFGVLVGAELAARAQSGAPHIHLQRRVQSETRSPRRRDQGRGASRHRD